MMKLKHFIGPVSFLGPPIFVNSMPKAGTNLFESFLVEMGYKRNLVRCLNETNSSTVKLKPRQSHFYVAHLPNDEIIHEIGHVKIFLKRELWGCLKSYVNYMAIDVAHPVSKYIHTIPLEDALCNLFFTSDNPNGRPLVKEYLRFHHIDESSYDLVVPFVLLVKKDQELISKLATLLSAKFELINSSLVTVLEGESYTKNAGRIDFFKELDEGTLSSIQKKVNLAEFEAYDKTV